MAGFLRKKSNADNKALKAAQNASPPRVAVGAPTPLYNKFASSSRSQVNMSEQHEPRRMVSGPMQLGTRRTSDPRVPTKASLASLQDKSARGHGRNDAVQAPNSYSAPYPPNVNINGASAPHTNTSRPLQPPYAPASTQIFTSSTSINATSGAYAIKQPNAPTTRRMSRAVVDKPLPPGPGPDQDGPAQPPDGVLSNVVQLSTLQKQTAASAKPPTRQPPPPPESPPRSRHVPDELPMSNFRPMSTDFLSFSPTEYDSSTMSAQKRLSKVHPHSSRPSAEGVKRNSAVAQEPTSDVLAPPKKRSGEGTMGNGTKQSRNSVSVETYSYSSIPTPGSSSTRVEQASPPTASGTRLYKPQLFAVSSPQLHPLPISSSPPATWNNLYNDSRPSTVSPSVLSGARPPQPADGGLSRKDTDPHRARLSPVQQTQAPPTRSASQTSPTKPYMFKSQHSPNHSIPQGALSGKGKDRVEMQLQYPSHLPLPHSQSSAHQSRSGASGHHHAEPNGVAPLTPAASVMEGYAPQRKLSNPPAPPTHPQSAYAAPAIPKGPRIFAAMAQDGALPSQANVPPPITNVHMHGPRPPAPQRPFPPAPHDFAPVPTSVPSQTTSGSASSRSQSHSHKSQTQGSSAVGHGNLVGESDDQYYLRRIDSVSAKRERLNSVKSSSTHGHGHTASNPVSTAQDQPNAPMSPVKQPQRVLSKARPTTPKSPDRVLAGDSAPGQLQLPSAALGRNSAALQLLDDDPFASSSVVKLLPPSRDGVLDSDDIPATASTPVRNATALRLPLDDALNEFTHREPVRSALPQVSHLPPATQNGPALVTITPSHAPTSKSSASQVEQPKPSFIPRPPPTPETSGAEDRRHRSARKRERHEKRRDKEVAAAAAAAADAMLRASMYLPTVPGSFPLAAFLSVPRVLTELLTYLTFFEWSQLFAVSKEVRRLISETKELREEVLSRFLCPIGYVKWQWEQQPEPMQLTIQDLHDYMRGVSIPTHQYSMHAQSFLQSLSLHVRDPHAQAQAQMARTLRICTRAYTRIVLRLRVQAEMQEQHPLSPPQNAAANSRYPPSAATKVPGGRSLSQGRGPHSRPPSRAPSPAFSQSAHGHGTPGRSSSALGDYADSAFHSPLYRLRRAPLLRVFVPSPDGDWLSDQSVLDCETELKKAGIAHLLRRGDVVWDTAVGDDANTGRLVWDGNFLIDLDFTYAMVGDIPKYLHTLSFPPSYFHRVIRTAPMNGKGGDSAGNPVAHIDVSPWGQEIAHNLQLIQDRVRTETAHGGRHNVVRWVHRSSFMVRPLHQVRAAYGTDPRLGLRVPIPYTNLFVDPGWYGTIVVEAEGTNEGLADLQVRCGVRPPGRADQLQDREQRLVWRILREKSRPGEIWIQAVTAKERLL